MVSVRAYCFPVPFPHLFLQLTWAVTERTKTERQSWIVGGVCEWRERSLSSLSQKYGTFWGGEDHSELFTDAEQRELQSIADPTLDHRQFSAVAGRGASVDDPTLHGPGTLDLVPVPVYCYTGTCKQNSCKARL